MKALWILLRSELYIGVRGFASKLILFGPALVAAAQLLLASAQQGVEEASGALGGSGFERAIAEGAYGHFVDGLNTGLTLLSLLLIGLAAYSISIERDVGTIRHLTIRRGNRLQLLAAKFIYLHLLAAAALLILLLSSYLLSAALWEFGPVTEDGFELISEQEIRSELALGLKLALIPLPAAIGFGLAVSAAAQSATQALSIALGFSLAIDLFKDSLGESSLYLYARFLPSINDQSYLAEVSRLVRGYSDVLVDPELLSMNSLVPWPSLLIFLLIGCLLLQKKSL